VADTTTHLREFKVMQRKQMLRYYGSRRRENAMNHLLIPFNCRLDAFVPTVTLSTALKTRYPARCCIVILSCVLGSVMKIIRY
jgi:hypothetical protein